MKNLLVTKELEKINWTSFHGHYLNATLNELKKAFWKI